jgi:hypothetical protein
VKRRASHLCVFLVVRGKGINGGIFDMMRYDNCTPATEVEAGKLEAMLYPGDRIPQWIVLRRFVPVGGPVDPTVGRWESFGWECDRRAFNEFADAESVAKIRNQELKR